MIIGRQRRKRTAISTLTIAIFLIWTPAVLSGPPHSAVSWECALADALAAVSHRADWQVLACEGDSMEPHFGRDSLLILQHTRLEELRAGMIVVYRDGDGDLVAHQVSKVSRETARTRGMCNSHCDPYPVTEENLVGTVFGILHTDGRNRNTESLPVALAKRY